MRWKIVAAGAAALMVLSTAAVAAPGDPDPTFGLDGTNSIDLSLPVDVKIEAVTVDDGGTSFAVGTTEDGRLAVAGANSAGEDWRFWDGRAMFGTTDPFVARDITQNGSSFYVAGAIGDDMGVFAFDQFGRPLYDFGRNGFARVPFAFPAVANAIVPTADGSGLLLAGTTDDAGDVTAAVTRLRLDGTVDTSFAMMGTLFTNVTASDDLAYDIAVDPAGSGAFVVVGESAGTGFVVRYEANGVPDEAFGTGGTVTVNPQSGTDAVNAVLVDELGRVLAAGNSGADWFVARLTAAGAYDTSFSTNGKVIDDFGGAADTLRGLAWREDGSFVAAGRRDGTTPFVAAFTATGAFDSTFSDDGKLTPIGVSGRAVDIGAGGGIVSVAVDTGGTPTLGLYLAGTGEPMDTGNAPGGIKRLAFGERLDDHGMAVARMSDGGYVEAISSRGALGLVRWTPGGELDETFGDFGVTEVELGIGSPVAVAVSSIDEIVVLTTEMTLLRFTPQGELDEWFGTDGIVDLEGTATGPQSLLVQADRGVVLVGATPAPGSQLVVHRRQANGSPDTGFDVDGNVVDPDVDAGVAVRLQGSSFVVAGYDTTDGATETVLLRYNATTGAADAAFTRRFAGGNPVFAVLSDQRVVLAHVALTGPLTSDIRVRRLQSTGADDPSFGAEGVVTVDVHGIDVLSDMAVQPDGRILVLAGVWSSFHGAPTVVRLMPGGAVDTAFGANGRIEPDEALFTALLAPNADHVVLAGIDYVETDQDAWIGRFKSRADAPAPKPPPPAPEPKPSGYRMLAADGSVYAFGDAVYRGGATGLIGPGTTAVDIEPDRRTGGYWIVDSAGHVFAFGGAAYAGGVPALFPGEQVTSISSTPSGYGYWLFTTRGRVFPFGDARHHGDMGHARLNGPVLDSVATPSGKGYYLVASDGGIFAFGDATFRGSMGAHRLNAPVQSLVPDVDGVGYWLVASDGGVFAFDAPFRGSMGASRLNRPVTGMVSYGNGYLMVAEDGGIFNFSDKPFAGSLGSNPPPYPVVSVAPLG